MKDNRVAARLREEYVAAMDNAKFHPDNFDGIAAEEKQAIINPKHYSLIPPGEYPQGVQYMGLVCFLLAKKDKLDRYEAHIYSHMMKYILRLGEKDSVRQDIKKILWYTELLQLYQDVKDNKATLQDFVAKWEIMEVMEQK